MNDPCYYHPEIAAAATCGICGNRICKEDRRIKVIEGTETMLCHLCFDESKSPKINPRMLIVVGNAVFTLALAIIILIVI